ncbi:hypothetical protein GDO78_008321 [Eleutherodactylus coqui]|uniref:Secreted protein n=1 Tax=Eleutherodactylus coqui TaxID=57060 RepID=A0A8J6FBQ4_ELECQ|nr:hypothetical protein GDO78_008321 [Eleutherodactylus coqui]
MMSGGRVLTSACKALMTASWAILARASISTRSGTINGASHIAQCWLSGTKFVFVKLLSPVHEYTKL